MLGRVYRYDARGNYGGNTELTEVSGTGTELVPNYTGVFGRVLRPYRTVPKASLGRISPSKYPRYTFVRILTHLVFGCDHNVPPYNAKNMSIKKGRLGLAGKQENRKPLFY